MWTVMAARKKKRPDTGDVSGPMTRGTTDQSSAAADETYGSCMACNFAGVIKYRLNEAYVMAMTGKSANGTYQGTYTIAVAAIEASPALSTQYGNERITISFHVVSTGAPSAKPITIATE